MAFHNDKHQRIIIKTNYGSIEIVGLKEVWVNCFLGTYRLMYQDSIYKYNCIYWSDTRSSMNRYLEYKKKIMDAYKRGDKVVEV